MGVMHPLGKRIRLARPALGRDEASALRLVLRDGFLTGGPRIEAFERSVAAAAGARFAVAVSSGTAALFLALRAAGVGQGDEVILPGFTFPATAGAVVAAAARPVVCDVDPRSFNLDPAKLEAALTPRTRAVMPVHLFGLPAPMPPILEFARAHGLKVIEDAACALGARLDGRPCGAAGDLGCFSFHPRKIVTTGEGGAVVSNDEELVAKVRLLRNHGIRRTAAGMEFELPAFNFRLSDLHAAVGLAQMKHLSAQLELRRELAAAMRAELNGLPWLQLPEEPAGSSHGWQSFVVRLAPDVDRAALLDHLGRDAIEAVPGAYALHLTRAFAPLVAPAAPPVSAELHRSTLALPFHTFLRPVELHRIAESLAGFRKG